MSLHPVRIRIFGMAEGDQVFEYDDNGKLLYRGVATLATRKETGAILFKITQYVYDGSRVVGINGPLPGVWADRGKLFK